MKYKAPLKANMKGGVIATMKKTIGATGGAVNGENHGTVIWTELDLVQD